MVVYCSGTVYWRCLVMCFVAAACCSNFVYTDNHKTQHNTTQHKHPQNTTQHNTVRCSTKGHPIVQFSVSCYSTSGCTQLGGNLQPTYLYGKDKRVHPAGCHSSKRPSLTDNNKSSAPHGKPDLLSFPKYYCYYYCYYYYSSSPSFSYS